MKNRIPMLSFALTFALTLALGCSSAAIETRGTAADAGSAAPEVAPGSGVLRPGFDAKTLAPEPEVASAAPLASSYTCPHHPEVVSDKPGVCPKCKMDLVPTTPAPGGKDPDGHDGHGHEGH
jgi:hypothetical protein